MACTAAKSLLLATLLAAAGCFAVLDPERQNSAGKGGSYISATVSPGIRRLQDASTNCSEVLAPDETLSSAAPP